MRQQGVYPLRTYLSGLLCFTSVIVVIVSIVWTEITTSLPVIVWTSGSGTTATATVESAVWLTTVTVPPMIAETGTCFLNQHQTHKPTHPLNCNLEKPFLRRIVFRFGRKDPVMIIGKHFIANMNIKYKLCPRPTDERGLGEHYPSHTEMALIYQSAAWILASLLLFIIVFLIVALLINKKKKWVQMSCYSAPKKVRSPL